MRCDTAAFGRVSLSAHLFRFCLPFFADDVCLTGFWKVLRQDVQIWWFKLSTDFSRAFPYVLLLLPPRGGGSEMHSEIHINHRRRLYWIKYTCLRKAFKSRDPGVAYLL